MQEKFARGHLLLSCCCWKMLWHVLVFRSYGFPFLFSLLFDLFSLTGGIFVVLSVVLGCSWQERWSCLGYASKDQCNPPDQCVRGQLTFRLPRFWVWWALVSLYHACHCMRAILWIRDRRGNSIRSKGWPEKKGKRGFKLWSEAPESWSSEASHDGRALGTLVEQIPTCLFLETYIHAVLFFVKFKFG